MAEWFKTTCLKCPHIFQNTCDDSEEIRKMIFPKTSVLLFFITSVSFAVILSFIPSFTLYLFGSKRQIGTASFPSPVVPDIGLEPVVFSYDTGQHTSLLKVKTKDKLNPDLEGEALAAMNLAREMLEQGKPEKALKLYDHALALFPQHPDILNQYGEFLETHRKNVVLAEHMYCLALIHSPQHSKALVNRKRTQPLVEDIDQNYFNRIDRKLKHLFSIPEAHPGLRRMKKESYYKHVYHTTAIEGNTMTLAQTRSIIETRMAISGKSVMEHNEILGLDAALSFVNSTLVHRIGKITQLDILDVHKRVLGFVDPVEAGRMRNTQVFVGDFTPPRANQLRTLMREFVDWLNSEEALNLHPIEFAALAHYKLVVIHPFYDGNGRTARLLMNLILMQAGFPPVIIRVEDKHLYYKHIGTGNNGDIRPFIRFIAQCTETTLNEYLWATGDPSSNVLEEMDKRKDDGRTILIDP